MSAGRGSPGGTFGLSPAIDGERALVYPDLPTMSSVAPNIRPAGDENPPAMPRAMAHEFNNLLTGILGFASLLTEMLPPGTEEEQAAAAIERNARKAANLARQFLEIARKNEMSGKRPAPPLD